jgi:hypothetical protein
LSANSRSSRTNQVESIQEVNIMNNTATYQPSETSSISHPVQCRWVPGTLDRVRVSDPEIRQDVILDLRDFLELANRDAVNALHLQGLAQLECDQTQWDVISAHQVMQWNDSAAYL